MTAFSVDAGAPMIVDGLGAVGIRVARELAGTPGLGPVILRSAHEQRHRLAVEALGDRVRPWRKSDEQLGGTVVLAREAEAHPDLVRRHVEAGRNVVSCADDPEVVRELIELDDLAKASGSVLVLGAACSPGLSCLLARHAANAVEKLISINIAMVGAGGPSCIQRRQDAAHNVAPVWRDGGWDTPQPGTKLAWFPDPIGAVDVGHGSLVEPLLLRRGFPEAKLLTASTAVGGLGASRLWDRVRQWRRPTAEPVGAIRVEVVGEIDGEEAMVVYAVVDRLAVAAAALAAVVALDVDRLPAGVSAVGEQRDPLPWLVELARRGVKAATFEPSI